MGELWFGEGYAPDSDTLIEKVSRSTAWVRTVEGGKSAIHERKPRVVVREDEGALVFPLNSAAPCSVEARCDYGVFSRRGATFLLQYHAKYLHVSSADQLAALAKSDKLPLDVVPTMGDGVASVQVLWEGKPAVGCEVVVIDPEHNELEATTDKEGRVKFKATAKGTYAVRVTLILADRGGERDGKKYDQTRHYSTVAFPIGAASVASAKAPAKPADKSDPVKNDPAATALLEHARQSRAVWKDFPGFTADMTIRVDGQSQRGKVTLDDAAKTKFDLPEKLGLKWAEFQFGQLVDHRLPSGELGQEARFLPADGEHPLGRLVQLDEPRMGSVYRIQDDVVREVNRNAGPTRFTISVIEIERNKEGKYLPKTFTVNTWDRKSGELVSNRTYTNSWVRVGSFDLPEMIVEVAADKGVLHVSTLKFENHKLLTKPAAR